MTSTTVTFAPAPEAFRQVEAPKYQSAGAAGMDLCACIPNNVTLTPGDRALIPTGLLIAIPEGFEGQVRPRSGLAYKNGVTVLNTPGTIDCDYRGEIKVLLQNLGNDIYSIKDGDRIAQLIISPVYQVECVMAADLSALPTDRGASGFGSTGA